MTKQTNGIPCTEQYISKSGGSTLLRPPEMLRRTQPNWRFQNPTASLIVDGDVVKVVYEWKAVDKKIIPENTNEE